ncbi:MAG: thiamine pyrophosphate-dependent enzyme [Bacteroidota bacterium]
MSEENTPQNEGKRPPVPGGAKPARPTQPVGKRPPTTKPALPPSIAGKKPTGPPKAGGKKPTRPPGAKPARPGVKPPGKPPGARPTKPPALRTVTPPGGDGDVASLPVLTRKDFASDADVRWCPGCGDYAVLAAVQRVLPELTERKEDVVFISGIGCSSRFPYYMDTYGMHSIHGRAPTVATGLKAARPDLDVWLITGDGDALSIGGNHFAHLMRRNLECQIILFNNQIYGLTKGQYSPTSEVGKVTKSTPYGSLDHPFNPAAFALGADATFVARTLDRDAKHMTAMLRRAHRHTGTGFVEVYQNCNIFNDGAFFDFTERQSKPRRTVFVEHGQPLTFDKGQRGLHLDGLRLDAIDLTSDFSADDCLVYDETDKTMAHAVITQLFWDAEMPRPFGVFYSEGRPTYDTELQRQVEAVTKKKGAGDLRTLLHDAETWTIS